ncbi:hypothetical protein [Bradyrhizobium sp. RDT46]|uniref:hypothetical protein n=1 Tax=Bradyrhizobium sp. RDT46 TaxID=3341829 RepID=UPI0035C75C09
MTDYKTEQDPADCLWCTAPLPTVRHWRTLFCGKACGNRYFNKLTADARLEARAKLTCVACGEPMSDAKRQDQKYCGKPCQQSAWQQRMRVAGKGTAPVMSHVEN